MLLLLLLLVVLVGICIFLLIFCFLKWLKKPSTTLAAARKLSAVPKKKETIPTAPQIDNSQLFDISNNVQQNQLNTNSELLTSDQNTNINLLSSKLNNLAISQQNAFQQQSNILSNKNNDLTTSMSKSSSMYTTMINK